MLERSYIPAECSRGGFSNFILFEKEEETKQYVYVRSFVSSHFEANWKEAYLRVNKAVRLESCRDSGDELSTRDCENNLGLYEEYKRTRDSNDFLSDGSALKERAPNSIKEKVVE